MVREEIDRAWARRREVPFPEIIGKALGQMGITLEGIDLLELEGLYYRPWAENVIPYRDTLGTMTSVKKTGLKIGLVSNVVFSENVMTFLGVLLVGEVSEVSAGGVVYRGDGARPQFLLIHDRYGKWTLPKGRVEKGETPEQAALREIREETGINGVIKGTVGDVRYVYEDFRGKVNKQVIYYLVEAVEGQVAAQLSEIRDAAWFWADDALTRFGYDNTVSIINHAIAMIP